MSTLQIAGVAILAVAAALALLELLFVLSWRFAPLHAPALLDRMMARRPGLRARRHINARYIGGWLSLAPRRAIRMRVRQLFPPTLLTDSRSDARWQVWYNVHIPAFIAAGSSRRHAPIVAAAIMDGLTDATRALVEEQRRAGGGPIAYDSFWPILESIEEIAAHLPASARQRFADKLLELCNATADETVQAASAWIVNELSTRTSNERALARTVIHRLHPGAPRVSRLALQILGTINADVEAALTTAIKESRRPRLADVCLDKYNTACAYALKRVEEFDESAPDAVGDFVRYLCDLERFDKQNLNGIEGLAWMAYHRTAFRALCGVQSVSRNAIEEVCREAMFCTAEQQTCAFLTIEALEPVRDKNAKQCVDAMSSFLIGGSGKFDQGIAVCISEGLEEERDRLSFPRSAAYWSVRGDCELVSATAELLDRVKSISRAEPMARWINIRLDLHEAAARSAAPRSGSTSRVPTAPAAS